MDSGRNHGITADLFTIIPTVGGNPDIPSLEYIKLNDIQAYLLDGEFKDENPDHRKAVGKIKDPVDLFSIGRATRDSAFMETLPTEDPDPPAKAARIWREIENQTNEIFSGLSGQNPAWTAKEGFIADIKDFQDFDTDQSNPIEACFSLFRPP